MEKIIDTNTIKHVAEEHLPELGITNRECEDILFDYIDVKYVVMKAIRKYRLAHPKMHYGWPIVYGRVELQIDGYNGYLVEVNEVKFDCTLALNRFDLVDLPWNGDFHETGDCNSGDEVYFECVHLGLVKDWDGPFDFYIDDEDEWFAYLDERVRREYGYEPEDRTLDPDYPDYC